MTVSRMAFFYYFHSQQIQLQKFSEKNQLRKITLFKNVWDSFKLHLYMTSKTEYSICMDLPSCLYMTRLCSNIHNVMAGGPNFASLLSLYSYQRYSGACIGLEKWRGKKSEVQVQKFIFKKTQYIPLFKGPDLFQELWMQEKLD